MLQHVPTGSNVNCTPPTIAEFPGWLTAPPPRYDLVTMASLLSLYTFYGLTIVSKQYLVPAMETLCCKWQLRYDVAGSTFLAATTSMPEFFVGVVGTCVAHGDIGLGTIVGSAIFNLLAVPAFSGLLSTTVIRLDWWPLTRDLVWYFLTVLLLALIISDGWIHAYEALLMIALLCTNWLHIFNDHRLQQLLRKNETRAAESDDVEFFERLLPPEVAVCEDDIAAHLEHIPVDKHMAMRVLWAVCWPLHALCRATIPNCQSKDKQHLYWFTLFISTIWISVLSYLITWMITVIGFNFFIPDSVMGLTFLAAGLSIPELVTSVLVARKGYGSMAITNAISSNSFDIQSLGVTWIIQMLLESSRSEFPLRRAIRIRSSSLTYTIGSLCISAVNMYLAFWASDFTLGVCVGSICLFAYLLCITCATLLEMNVFALINLPICSTN